MNKKQLTSKLSAIAVSILLASCGGGGGGYYSSSGTDTGSSGGTNGGTGTPVAIVSSIAIAQTKAALTTGAVEDNSLDLTIRALDAQGGIVAKAPITLEIVNLAQSGANLTTATSLTTDDAGLVKTSIQLQSQKIEDRLNHNVVLKVKSGNFVQEINIPVIGTSIQLASDNYTLHVGSNAKITVTAKDGKGDALTGAKVKLVDENSAQITTNVATIGNDGFAKIEVPASIVSSVANKQMKVFAEIEGNAGYLKQRSSESITLIALTQNNDFTFTSTNQATKIDTDIPVSVKIKGTTADALTGKVVNFITTIGKVSPASSTITNIQQENGGFVGIASTTLKGDVAGIATVSAKFEDSTISTEQRILAGDPKTVALSSDTSVLAPNSSTRVVAIVRDTKGSPVQGVPVQFKLTQDTSSTGRLSPASAITDAMGQASVIYTAGAAQTLSNQVKIDAETLPTTIYPTPRYAQNLPLSVSDQSAYITIAQDHLTSTDGVYYVKNFSATVIDTVGRPIKNQIVSISLVPKGFSKGFYVYTVVDPAKPDEKKWSQVVTNTCLVDYAFPAALLSDTGTSVGTSTTYTTDDQGRFNFKVSYGKNYANWFTATINAATLVSTKDNLTALAFYAPALADDFDDSGKIAPPNVRSPYGVGTSCSDYQ